MENRIIDLCFALDFWVFGGYVRDVMICGKTEFNDIDICVPRSKHSSVDNFLNALSVFYTIDVTRDTKIPDMKYGAMSMGITAVVHVTLNNQLKLDLCLFDGNLSDWCEEHSVDMSCNLFYTSRSTPLGIRYIPKKYRYLAAPARKLIEMTRNGIFETVYETRPDPFATQGEAVAECRKVRHVMRRAKKLIERGWFLKGDLLTTQMKEWAYTAGPVWESCIDAEQERIEAVQKDAQADATDLPQSVRDEVRRKLDL
jgi:hypothetical protein